MTDRARTPPDVPPVAPGVRGANMLLMFVLEMAVYVGVVWMAVSLDLPVTARIAVAILLFLVFAGVWALLGAPRAVRPVRGPARVALEVLWFGAGVTAFVLAGQQGLGAALGILFALNLVLRLAWRQTPTLPGGGG